MTNADGLFHIDPDGTLRAMRVTPYEAESLLQGLLADHPDLLAGGQMYPDEPRRWLLVQREHGVPDREGAVGDRWSLDHLFVDQEAIPTLVEVKRSSDTRIRREVVGQMMDYAANGVRYWPVERLRSAFAATQKEEQGRDPEAAVVELTQDPTETVEGFFLKVEDNLRAGRIRMVFVADLIPDELRRIVEFLNEQMNPAEVFAVEVKQYLADGYHGRTIVPTVHGRTAQATAKQSARSGADPEVVRAQAKPETHQVAEFLRGWVSGSLKLRETPTGLQVKRTDGSTLAQLYFGYNTLDVDLLSARSKRGDQVAEAAHQALQAMTSKPLTVKYPSVPTTDVAPQVASLGTVLEDLI